MSKVEESRIAFESHCRVGWGKWEDKSSWQKPQNRQTHLDFVPGTVCAEEEFKARRDVAVQDQCFMHMNAGVGRVMAPPKRPCPSPQSLRMCYMT